MTGLPAGTLHYRAVAITDFGTFAGPDATVEIPAATTPPPTPPTGDSARLAHHLAPWQSQSEQARSDQGHGHRDARRRAGAGSRSSSPSTAPASHEPETPQAPTSCLQLGHDGKLHTVKPGKHNTCQPTAFLNPTGTTGWTLKLRHHLPKGSYIAISEAIDTAGHTERIDSGDQARFQIT